MNNASSQRYLAEGLQKCTCTQMLQQLLPSTSHPFIVFFWNNRYTYFKFFTHLKCVHFSVYSPLIQVALIYPIPGLIEILLLLPAMGFILFFKCIPPSSCHYSSPLLTWNPRLSVATSLPFSPIKTTTRPKANYLSHLFASHFVFIRNPTKPEKPSLPLGTHSLPLSKKIC